MLRNALVFALILSLPAPARSGGPDLCAECSLGLFDEPKMLTPFGDIIPLTLENLYLGLRAAPPVQGLEVLQFSRIQILAFAAIPNGKRLAVLHRFPPTDPTFGLEHPVVASCDAPLLTPVLVRGSDYILDPVVRVEGETWSGIKKLYR